MNILKALIILIIVVTATIMTIKPGMHKPLRAENQDFQLTIVTETPKPAENTLDKHVKTVKEQAEKTENVIIPQTQPKEVKQDKTTKPVEKKKIAVSDAPKPQKTETKQSQNPVAQEKPQQPKKQQQKKLTPEEEELLAWNEWRSNLQNKVMRDVVLAAPIGTRFEFSFTVDKQGRISNLKVWSKNPDYTDLAVRTIKPVLQSYQGQSILKFPEKSKRVITNVTGGFSIARSSRYSTPSDYSDYEKIKK